MPTVLAARPAGVGITGAETAVTIATGRSYLSGDPSDAVDDRRTAVRYLPAEAGGRVPAHPLSNPPTKPRRRQGADDPSPDQPDQALSHQQTSPQLTRDLNTRSPPIIRTLLGTIRGTHPFRDLALEAVWRWIVVAPTVHFDRSMALLDPPLGVVMGKVVSLAVAELGRALVVGITQMHGHLAGTRRSSISLGGP